MSARILPLCALALAGCATASPGLPVSRPAPAVEVVPVAFAELRGTEVALFPDIPVPETVARTEAHLRSCYPGRVTRTPSGFRVDGVMTVIVATISRSSALGLEGPGLTPATQEALASSVQGRPRCA